MRSVAGEGVRRGRRFGDVHLAQKTRGVLLGEFEGTFENGQAERPINDLIIFNVSRFCRRYYDLFPRGAPARSHLLHKLVFRIYAF